MQKVKKIPLTLAIVILICFFLPWVQVSCGGSTDSSTGAGLAHNGTIGLWFIPILMLVVVAIGLGIIRSSSLVLGMTTLLCGLGSGLLMNQQRLKFEDRSGLVAINLTGWFWVALFSSALLVAVGAYFSIGRHDSS